MNDKNWLKSDIDSILTLNEKYWYTFQVYYNNELSVKERINDLIVKNKLSNVAYVLCPYEEVISITLKKKDRNVLKKAIFPGYIFICFNEPLTTQQRALILSLPKVSKLLQAVLSINDLAKLQQNIDKVLNSKAVKYRNQYNIDDKIIVTSGPFENFKGVITKVEPENQKVIVNLQILKRDTPTEIDIAHIAHYGVDD